MHLEEQLDGAQAAVTGSIVEAKKGEKVNRECATECTVVVVAPITTYHAIVPSSSSNCNYGDHFVSQARRATWDR